VSGRWPHPLLGGGAEGGREGREEWREGIIRLFSSLFFGVRCLRGGLSACSLIAQGREGRKEESEERGEAREGGREGTYL
jgi:hypothetical protein